MILNLNPVPKENWEVIVKREYTTEVFNSDDSKYYGSGFFINDRIECVPLEDDETKYRLTVKLPPLAGIVLK